MVRTSSVFAALIIAIVSVSPTLGKDSQVIKCDSLLGYQSADAPRTYAVHPAKSLVLDTGGYKRLSSSSSPADIPNIINLNKLEQYHMVSRSKIGAVTYEPVHSIKQPENYELGWNQGAHRYVLNSQTLKPIGDSKPFTGL